MNLPAHGTYPHILRTKILNKKQLTKNIYKRVRGWKTRLTLIYTHNLRCYATVTSKTIVNVREKKRDTHLFK